MRRVPGNIGIYALIAAMTIVSLIVLLHLREQFAAHLQNRIADLQRVFSSSALLKSPSDFKISFAGIEAEVAKYENRGEFGPIVISKNFGETTHIIYPFYLGAKPDATAHYLADIPALRSHRDLLSRLLSDHRHVTLPLESDNQALGQLHVVVNYTALRIVSFMIWVTGGLLAITLLYMALQFRKQEKVISATTVELEEKRREMVRLERLSLAGQLSANILHDLKKPVLNIRNEADEVLNPLPGMTSESSGTVFGRIREQADFFLSVLREGGYDRFVRAQDEREYIDVNEMLDRSVALVRYEQGNIEIRKDYHPSLLPVFAEPVRIVQVFSNLILNACQAMGGEGVIDLKTSVTADQNVLVNIIDNGPGIPAEKQDKIFEPFFTTKDPGQGTGLGLYIVQEIVQELGGAIEVSSQTGRTEFSVILPAQMS